MSATARYLIVEHPGEPNPFWVVSAKDPSEAFIECPDRECAEHDLAILAGSPTLTINRRITLNLSTDEAEALLTLVAPYNEAEAGNDQEHLTAALLDGAIRQAIRAAGGDPTVKPTREMDPVVEYRQGRGWLVLDSAVTDASMPVLAGPFRSEREAERALKDLVRRGETSEVLAARIAQAVRAVVGDYMPLDAIMDARLDQAIYKAVKA